MASVIIIGAGHNGLTAAFYLARAGLRPIVLERRADVGGGAITTELHPGFRCPTLTHETLLHAGIVSDMHLPQHGLTMLPAAPVVYAPALDGPPLVIDDDVARTADRLRRLSASDAGRYSAFRTSLDRVARVLGRLCTIPPPDLDRPTPRDVWDLLRLGRQVRGLGRRDAYRLLRWAPMPVADFTEEWFEHDLLRAAIAAPGLSGTMLGLRSAGSTLVLLMREAHRHLAGAVAVRGGPGAMTQAMAASAAAAGAEIRTGVPVERIVVRDGRATGVIAAGRELPASIVVSALDPKTTFVNLIDPLALQPGFATRIRHYRAAGTVAKVNLALAALPVFRGQPDVPGVLSGRIHIGPSPDYLEQAFDHAKYGEVSERPWLDVRIPSVLDSELAPPGAHVASIYAHYAPYGLRHQSWEEARTPLLESVLRTLEDYAPGVSALVVAAEVVTPAALERDYGYWGGHVFHGELAMDQLFAMRPLLGHARYSGPIEGLFLCSAGTHPGGFCSGASGRLAAAEILARRR